MRFGALLLCSMFALASATPCATGSRALRDLHASAHAAGHALHHGASAAPCHETPASSVKAPCPCGCEKRAPGSRSAPLGFALLSAPAALPEGARAAPASASRATLAAAPPREIEKVPRAA